MAPDKTWNEYVARNLQDPEYAAAHAVGQPFSNLALNVWSLRRTRGLTQHQLAEAAGMKQPRIATIERDDANPTLLTISRIAFALGVTADRLLAQPDEGLMADARAIADAEAATGSPRPRRADGLVDDPEARAEPPAPGRRRNTA